MSCGAEYGENTSHSACIKCQGILTVVYDYEELAQQISLEDMERRIPSVWKYIELLPVSKESRVASLGEGGTFLHKCKRLSDELGLRNLYLKDETTNPTGSFLDRGATVIATKAHELNFKKVICAAKGNLGASLAAYAAKAGLQCRIYISREIDLGKLYQMIAYGAEVKLARNFEDASIKARSRSKEGRIISARDPFLMEGIKTTGYEICEQLGWRTPDRIVVPMGNGGHLTMIWKALKELQTLGFIEKAGTTMTGVQASGCAPIVKAFRGGKEEAEAIEITDTLAVDISVRKPIYGSAALMAIRNSDGTAVAVSDEEMLEATHLLAQAEGVFAEPAAASTIAGLKRMVEEGAVRRDEEIVCIITGAGLKDPKTARRFTERINEIGRLVPRIEDRKITVKIGETKLCILRILSEGQKHGYGVWKDLNEKFGLSIRIPSVYQHLYELEKSGIVRRTGSQKVYGRLRWYYGLTDKGGATLKTLEELKI